MQQMPRPFSTTFFSWKELATSVLQGLLITVGTLTAYQYAVSAGFDESLTRTMVFVTLIIANIFLTLVNRSFYYSIFTTLKYKNRLVSLIISITLVLLWLLIFVKPLANFFAFTPLTIEQLGICLGVGFISVIWFEVVKWWKRRM